MVVQNPTLDSISEFVNNGNGTITATILSVGEYAPEHVSTGENTYIVGNTLYISGAETAENNGQFTIVYINADSPPVIAVTYTNPSGVTQSGQFALCSPSTLTIVKSVTDPITITAATPFSYNFHTPGPFNQPPTYGNNVPFVNASGSYAGTSNHIITEIVDEAPFRTYYKSHDLTNLYPYGFKVSITLPIIDGPVGDNGSNYLTFDSDSIVSGDPGTLSVRYLLFDKWSVGTPFATAIDSVNGVLYVSDYDNNAIRKVVLSTGFESVIAGSILGMGNTVRSPAGLALDQARQILYVTNALDNKIRKIALATLEVSDVITLTGDPSSAYALAYKSTGNILYCASHSDGKIVSISLDVLPLAAITVYPDIEGPWSSISFDATNGLLYALTNYASLYVFDVASSVPWSAGDALATGLVPGGGGVAASATGAYFSDAGTNKLYYANYIGTPSVTLIAGSGTASSVDGIGTAATFNQPRGVAYSGTNILYVSDYGGQLLRKVFVWTGYTYVVSTVYDFASTPNIDAWGVTTDTSGNRYITGSGTDINIYAIDPLGVYSEITVAGTVFSPRGVVIDALETSLYYVDYYGTVNKLRISNGELTIIAGSLYEGSSTDVDTIGLQVNSSAPVGRYIAGCSANSVYRLLCATPPAAGDSRAIYRSVSGGSWTAATFSPSPGDGWVGIASSTTGDHMVAVTAGGEIYTSSTFGASFSYVMTIMGSPLTVSASSDGSTMYVASPSEIWNVGVPPPVYISPYSSGFTGIFAITNSISSARIAQVFLGNVVRIGTDWTGTPHTVPTTGNITWVAIDNSGSYVAAAEDDGYIWIATIDTLFSVWVRQTNAGSRGWRSITACDTYFIAAAAEGVFMNPGFGTKWVNASAYAPDQSFISVAVSSNGNTAVATADRLGYLNVYSLNTNQTPSFSNPQWIDVDPISSDYLIVSTASGTLRYIDLTVLPFRVSTVAAGLSDVRGVAISPTVNEYAYIAKGNTILGIDLSGATTLIAGSTTAGGQDGTGSAARFSAPTGIGFDNTNTLYVSDFAGNKIRKVNVVTGVVKTIAGTGAAGEDDDYGEKATFTNPCGLAVARDGYAKLYVLDNATKILREIDLTNHTDIIAVVTTDVLATMTAGTNAITMGGSSYIYSTGIGLPTITCAPNVTDTSYTLTLTVGSTQTASITRPAIFTTGDGALGVQVCLNYGAYSGYSGQIQYASPLPILGASHGAAEIPFMRYDVGGTTPSLVPYIGGTDILLTISSDYGFPFIPGSLNMTYVLEMYSSSTGLVFDTVTNTITVIPFSILVDPPLVSPLTLYMYQPFTYTFSIPDYAVNTILNAVDYSSPVLAPYLTLSTDKTVLTFSSTGLKFSLPTAGLNVNAFYGTETDAIASSSNVLYILPTYVLVTPSIPSGVPLGLYKYEPFSYVFTIAGAGSTLTLRYTNSSSPLIGYCSLSPDSQIFTFAGTPVASYSSTFALVVDLMNGTTVESTTTYSVTISSGRVTFTPASPYVLSQYENISYTLGSNIVCSSSNTPDSVVCIPTLPYGLYFSNLSNIVGTPQFQQTQKNYQIIASNSTDGRISTGTIAIRVGVPVVRISPYSASFTGLTMTSTPTATFTARLPDSIYSYSFKYTWSPPLPSGLVFTDINDVIQPYGPGFSPVDSSNTVKLAGTPNMTDALSFPSSGIVPVTLTGTYKNAANVQIIGTAALSLQFAETVLITTSVSPNLYVGKELNSGNVVIGTASYFPSTSQISNVITTNPLPDGLELVATDSSKTSWYLSGTPTTAGTTSTTIVATNSNAISNTAPLVITINPDIVTFTLTPPNPTFTVSLPLASNSFQVRAEATSGSSVTYTASLDFPLYGLSLDSNSGELSGVPTSNFGPGIVVFTATDTLGAFATYSNTAFTIRRDVFTWPVYAPTYFQNRIVTPYQLVVSTLSGRTIQSFSSTNMPPGLTLSPSGLISGTFTGSTDSTFTVTATTGYQPPSTTATQTYSYIAKADNILILLANGTEPISNTFSTVQFASVQYSSDTIVNASYSIAGTYPIQYPEPLLTISPTGLLSGDFTGVPGPYPTYLVDVASSYGGVTSTVTSVLSLNNTPTPFMLAGVATDVNTTAQTIATTSYVFNATTSGTHSVTNQSWGGSGLPSGQVASSPRLYPDIGRIGTGFVSVTPHSVFDGVYTPSTQSVVWTNNTPVQSPYPSDDRFGCVTTDGGSNWLLVQLSTPIVSFQRSSNTGPWTQSGEDLTAFATNVDGNTTLGYINGNYIFGQASNYVCRNILYYNPVVDSRSWQTPATPPTFSNILRFATSNDTIVAVGCNAPLDGSPISYSTDYGSNWIMPDVPAWMQGPNVIFRDIAYANNTWVTCGIAGEGSNIIAYSSDLSNWQLYSDADTIEWSALAFNGNAWTVAGSYYNPTSEQYETRFLSLDAGNWPDQATSMSVSPFLLADTTAWGTIRFSRLITAFFSNTPSFTGTAFIPPGPLQFIEPVQSNYILYQYVPYVIPVAAVTTTDFIFYYASGLPVGFQLVLDPTGTTASITATSPSNGITNIVLYAKTTNSAATAYRLSVNTVIPYFTNPQVGAAAYTAILREHVNADAAQNARDSIVYPQVNSLAGPFMAPHAPNVITQVNCFLKLCRKPCASCRSSM